VIGSYWFVGLAPILAILISFPFWKNLFLQENKSLLQKRALVLLVLWELGAFSWQVLMRQHAAIHGFTYIHPANGILLFAALSSALLWETRKKLVLCLLALQLCSAGMLISSEIWLPFVRTMVSEVAQASCQEERDNTRLTITGIQSPISSLVKKELQQASMPAVDCRPAHRAWLLKSFVYIFKSSSY
jgi:hypothetical protein